MSPGERTVGNKRPGTGARGRLFIVSAPSGAGKSTLCGALMARCPNLAYSVSHTTRAPRGQERHGKDYYFISEKEFQALIENGALLEWARVHGSYYGTAAEVVMRHLAAGRDILMDIDVQGARQVVARHPDAVTIFIAPPSMEVLGDRLAKRGTDDSGAIRGRLAEAENEMAQKDFYGHVIVNDDLETAKMELVALIDSYGSCTDTDGGRDDGGA